MAHHDGLAEGPSSVSVPGGRCDQEEDGLLPARDDGDTDDRRMPMLPAASMAFACNVWGPTVCRLQANVVVMKGAGGLKVLLLQRSRLSKLHAPPTLSAPDI